MVVAISASVGKGGKNVPTDVIAVKKLLNAKLPPPWRDLIETGDCDDTMVDALMAFQKLWIPNREPDGKVDPNGTTLRLLNSKDVIPPPPTPIGVPLGTNQVTTTVPKPDLMRDSAWRYVLAFTKRHEAAVPHMYNNRQTEEGKQDVTCGIGVLLLSADVAVQNKGLFYDPATGATPSDEQMIKDWNEAAKLTRTAKNLADYGKVCTMRMAADKMIDAMAKILKSKQTALMTYPNCKDDFAGFKDFPAAAQAFCVSFAYGRIPVDFPTMRAAIKAQDWAKASENCRMSGAAALKNEAHRQLLLFAQKVVDDKLDIDTVPATLY